MHSDSCLLESLHVPQMNAQTCGKQCCVLVFVKMGVSPAMLMLTADQHHALHSLQPLELQSTTTQARQCVFNVGSISSSIAQVFEAVWTCRAQYS